MAYREALNDVSNAPCFELYHENSKIGRRVRPLPLLPNGRALFRDSDSDQHPLFAVGEAAPAGGPAGGLAGKAPGAPHAGHLSLRDLAALLADGAPDDGEPIDIYFHARAVDGLPAGLFRLGARGAARLIRRSDLGRDLGEALMAPEPALAPLQIVIAGAFARAAATGGERGYRRALMAAGARAQAISWTAASLGLGIAAITEFYDREVDTILGLDGVDIGALVVLAVGPAA